MIEELNIHKDGLVDQLENFIFTNYLRFIEHKHPYNTREAPTLQFGNTILDL